MLCYKMPGGSRKDVLLAHARIQWRQAGQSEAGCMRRGGVFTWPAASGALLAGVTV